jgi:hypothetical protein
MHGCLAETVSPVGNNGRKEGHKYATHTLFVGSVLAMFITHLGVAVLYYIFTAKIDLSFHICASTGGSMRPAWHASSS